ncbi:hypothetical protein D3C83_263850 [compost metagenome]
MLGKAERFIDLPPEEKRKLAQVTFANRVVDLEVLPRTTVLPTRSSPDARTASVQDFGFESV